VVFKEGTPGLRRRPPASNHVLTYTGFANVDPQFFGVHRGSSEHPRVDSRGSSCGSVRGLRRAPSGDRIGHDESSMSRTCEIPGDAIPLRLKLARCGCRTSSLSRQNGATPKEPDQPASALAASLIAAGCRSGGEAQESQVEAQRDFGTNLKTKLLEP